jgi:hypothetical protein
MTPAKAESTLAGRHTDRAGQPIQRRARRAASRSRTSQSAVPSNTDRLTNGTTLVAPDIWSTWPGNAERGGGAVRAQVHTPARGMRGTPAEPSSGHDRSTAASRYTTSSVPATTGPPPPARPAKGRRPRTWRRTPPKESEEVSRHATRPATVGSRAKPTIATSLSERQRTRGHRRSTTSVARTTPIRCRGERYTGDGEDGRSPATTPSSHCHPHRSVRSRSIEPPPFALRPVGSLPARSPGPRLAKSWEIPR